MEDTTAKFVRLNNGDDLICELVELSENDLVLYMIINPLKVVYVPTSKAGYMQVAFMPWIFPNMVEHQEFTVSPDDVLIISDASSKMNKYYWENLDQLNTSTPLEEIEEPEDNRQEQLQELIETLTSPRRTYH